MNELPGSRLRPSDTFSTPIRMTPVRISSDNDNTVVKESPATPIPVSVPVREPGRFATPLPPPASGGGSSRFGLEKDPLSSGSLYGLKDLTPLKSPLPFQFRGTSIDMVRSRGRELVNMLSEGKYTTPTMSSPISSSLSTCTSSSAIESAPVVSLARTDIAIQRTTGEKAIALPQPDKSPTITETSAIKIRVDGSFDGRREEESKEEQKAGAASSVAEKMHAQATFKQPSQPRHEKPVCSSAPSVQDGVAANERERRSASKKPTHSKQGMDDTVPPPHDVLLSSWVIRLVQNDPQITNVGLKMAPEWIVLEGQKKLPNDNKVLWHSSLIVSRVSSRVMQTSSGKKYFIQGDMEVSAMKLVGWTDNFMNEFREGFPEDWIEKIIEDQRLHRKKDRDGADEPRIDTAQPVIPRKRASPEKSAPRNAYLPESNMSSRTDLANDKTPLKRKMQRKRRASKDPDIEAEDTPEHENEDQEPDDSEMNDGDLETSQTVAGERKPRRRFSAGVQRTASKSPINNRRSSLSVSKNNSVPIPKTPRTMMRKPGPILTPFQPVPIVDTSELKATRSGRRVSAPLPYWENVYLKPTREGSPRVIKFL